MTGVLIRKPRVNTETQRRGHEDRGRDWGDTSMSQGMPRISSNHQKLGKKKKDSLLEPPEGPLLTS